MQGEVVLVVGGTGDVGGRVVDTLLTRGKRVRALVRAGTDSSRLAAKGGEGAPGDMLDPASLDRAMAGADAVVTTAIGYLRRRRGDSLQTVDDLGNRNLVDAANRSGVRRFVFTSILTCDRARDVPHFWQKKLTEDYLERSGGPFARPGPGRGLAEVFGKLLGGGVRPSLGMLRMFRILGSIARPFSSRWRDMGAMGRFFETGKYVADTRVQAELFGPLPTAEDTARRMLAGIGPVVRG